MVLATVAGHRSGTTTITLSADQLARAIELLAPAEACSEVERPNLAAWRALHSAALASPGETWLVAVFVGDFDDSISSEADMLLRQQVARQLA